MGLNVMICNWCNQPKTEHCFTPIELVQYHKRWSYPVDVLIDDEGKFICSSPSDICGKYNSCLEELKRVCGEPYRGRWIDSADKIHDPPSEYDPLEVYLVPEGVKIVVEQVSRVPNIFKLR